MHGGWRHKGGQTAEQVERTKNDSRRAIAALLEALLGHRGASQISTERKEALTVSSIDADIGVHLKSLDLGTKHGGLRDPHGGGVDQAHGGLAGQDIGSLHRSCVAVSKQRFGV